MPMLDAYIPDGALTPEAERKLLATCTELLLEHEGADPTNERFRSLAWVFVHRHETYVAGAPADAPHYRFVCQVPEGQYDDQRRAAVTKAMTDALVEAEGALPTPGGPDDFPRLVQGLASGDPAQSPSRAARTLWAIRWKLGKLLGWDAPDTGLGSRVPTLRDRVPADLRDAPSGPDFDA